MRPRRARRLRAKACRRLRRGRSAGAVVKMCAELGITLDCAASGAAAQRSTSEGGTWCRIGLRGAEVRVSRWCVTEAGTRKPRTFAWATRLHIRSRQLETRGGGSSARGRGKGWFLRVV